MPPESKPPNDTTTAQAPDREPGKPKSRRRWGSWALGVLNGVVGDYLHERGNELQVDMGVMHDGRVVPLDTASLARAFPGARSRICVFVHGLVCTESLWSWPDVPEMSYGELLRRDFGWTPVYVRYNTGLRISDNGERFDVLLDKLLASWQPKLEELVLVGHSMGGLVIRSACHTATTAGHRWTDLVTRAVYLGSPHQGAPLERFGNVLSWLLRATPTPYTRVAADAVDLRSKGIKDLRFSNLVRQDWEGRDPDGLLDNRRGHIPLLPHVEHYLAAGTLARDERNLLNRLVGDGLVTVPSASGRPAGSEQGPLFPQENVRVFPGIDHMALAYHPEVYEQLKSWLARPRSAAAPGGEP